MRLTKKQAHEKAKNIAIAYLTKMGIDSSRYEISEAKPDAVNRVMDGKTNLRWSVIVNCYIDGSQLDGPMVLLVNLATEEAQEL